MTDTTLLLRPQSKAHEDALTVRHRVCYADTDAGGVVYHSRYIELVEHARNRLMYEAGFSFAQLARDHQVMLIVHKVVAEYHAPALLEDEITLRSRLTQCRASRSVWVTDVRRGDASLATIAIEMVAMHVQTRQLAFHPQAFLDALAPYVEEAPRHFSTKARSIT